MNMTFHKWALLDMEIKIKLHRIKLVIPHLIPKIIYFPYLITNLNDCKAPKKKKNNKEGKQKTKFDSIIPGTQIFFFITFNMTCYD